MVGTRKQIWPATTVIAAAACLSVLSPCVAHQPVSPQDFAAWTQQRFPHVMLAKIENGTIRYDGGDGHSYETAVIVLGAASEAEVSIADGVVTGKFPKRALGHVLEWYDLHKKELLEDWSLATKRKPLKKIPPLE